MSFKASEIESLVNRILFFPHLFSFEQKKLLSDNQNGSPFSKVLKLKLKSSDNSIEF